MQLHMLPESPVLSLFVACGPVASCNDMTRLVSNSMLNFNALSTFEDAEMQMVAGRF